MSNLLTKKEIPTIQFYQMPKVFFGDSIYQAMRNESKLAYMLLRDLLPLSIANNWVNEKGEVFVKLSRAKLMSLLNIKGTQKIAQVMKELVDYGLIIYKQVGLTKCNEIYLYPPKGAIKQEGDNHTPNNSKNNSPRVSKSNPSQSEFQTHINTNITKTNSNKTNDYPSIYLETNQEDEKIDLQSLYERFSKQVHTDYLYQHYDKQIADEVINNMCHMYISKSTMVNGQAMPNSIVRSILAKLDFYHLEHVIDQYLEAIARRDIHHTRRYIQTLIYNSTLESATRARGLVRREMGY